MRRQRSDEAEGSREVSEPPRVVRRNSQKVLPWRSYPVRALRVSPHSPPPPPQSWDDDISVTYRQRSASARAAGGPSTCTMPARRVLCASWGGHGTVLRPGGGGFDGGNPEAKVGEATFLGGLMDGVV